MPRTADSLSRRASTGPRSVLVVPFADGIGDFVMMLPLLRHVRRHFPGAAITVAASERSALLLDEDAGLTVRTPSWLRERPRPRGGPLRRLVPQSLLARIAGVALRLELGPYDRTLNLFYWWERGVDFGRHWTPQVPALPGAVHTLDVLADHLGRELNAPLSGDARRPRVTIRRAAAAWADAWWQAAGLRDAPVVALVPESNMAIKRWPLQHWAHLARALATAGCRTLVAVPPGPAGDETHAALCRLTRRPLDALREPLDRVAAAVARCSLVVGVDTGLLHLAAAVGTRYVGLFGPTNPSVTGPYDQTIGTTLVAPYPKTAACRGCWRQFKYIDDRCAALGSPSCMGHLRPEDVFDAILRQLPLPARRATASVALLASPPSTASTPTQAHAFVPA